MTDIPGVRAQLVDYASREITFAELGQRTQRILGAQAHDRALDILVAGANDIRNDIVRGMRNSPPTGKLYFRYFRRTKKGAKKAVFHRASQPGMPPRPDTGDMLRSIIVDARWAEIEVGSILTNPAYPKWLEEGTKNMDARPWLFPPQATNVPRIKASMTRMLRGLAEEMTR
jgi:hypothetical protein